MPTAIAGAAGFPHPARAKCDSKGALGRVHHWFSVTDEGGSTTLAKGAEVVEPSFLAKVMSWRLARDLPKNCRADLEKIKGRLEA